MSQFFCVCKQTSFQEHRCPNGQVLFKNRYNVEKVPALGHQQRGISRSVLCLLLNLSGGLFSPPSYCSKENTVSHHISVCQHLFALWFKCVQWEGNRAVPFTAGDTFCCDCFSDGWKWSINICSLEKCNNIFLCQRDFPLLPPHPAVLLWTFPCGSLLSEKKGHSVTIICPF